MVISRRVPKQYSSKTKAAKLKAGEKFIGYGMRRMMMSIDMTSGKK